MAGFVHWKRIDDYYQIGLSLDASYLKEQADGFVSKQKIFQRDK